MNDKIVLSEIKKKDLELLKKWRNNPRILKFNTQYFLLNMEHQKRWFDEIKDKGTKSKMFVFRYRNKTIGVGGLIHLDNKNKNADIAIILGESKMQGKGFGKKMLQLLVDYGFEKMKLHRIGAEIFEYNIISLKLFEKLNFKKEAEMKDVLWRDGKWWKIFTYSIINLES